MCTPFLSTSSLQIPLDWQVVPLVVMCVRVLFPPHFLLTPAPFSHQDFLTGYPCALVCDFISYGMKGFCRKTGLLVRRALQAPLPGKGVPCCAVTHASGNSS